MAGSPNRGIAQSLVWDLARTFRTPTRIVKEIINVGLSYRRQNMYIDVNKAIQTFNKRDASQAFDRYASISRELLVETPFRRNEQYRVYGLATYRNKETGLMSTRLASFYTNLNAPENIQQDQFAERFNTKGQSNDRFDVIGFYRLYVEHNSGTAYSQYEELHEI